MIELAVAIAFIGALAWDSHRRHLNHLARQAQEHRLSEQVNNLHAARVAELVEQIQLQAAEPSKIRSEFEALRMSQGFKGTPRI